ncbi:MAG: hypothetical protein FJ297_09880 [Planctomycetes bacterium]|nr:hypothetical protein [Planctomycetota bacterium]
MRNVRCLPWTIVLTLAASGCAICPPGDDDAYSYWGGATQRSHPTFGRAGSRFDEGDATFIEAGPIDASPIDGEGAPAGMDAEPPADDVDMTFDGGESAGAGADH